MPPKTQKKDVPKKTEKKTAPNKDVEVKAPVVSPATEQPTEDIDYTTILTNLIQIEKLVRTTMPPYQEASEEAREGSQECV